MGEVVASKMVNYGKEWQGINFADAQDPYYNPEKPRLNLQELEKNSKLKGSIPIHLDMTVDCQAAKKGVQKGKLYEAIYCEAALGAENVVVIFNNSPLKTMTSTAIWLRLLLRKITII